MSKQHHWHQENTGKESEVLLSGPCGLLRGRVPRFLKEMPKKSLTWSFFSHLDASEAITQWQDQSFSSWQDSTRAPGMVWGFLSALICRYRCSERMGCWRDGLRALEVATHRQQQRQHKGWFSGVEHWPELSIRRSSDERNTTWQWQPRA